MNIYHTELSEKELIEINAGEKPADWDNKSTGYKIGYAIGHATAVTLEFAGSLLFPWV